MVRLSLLYSINLGPCGERASRAHPEKACGKAVRFAACIPFEYTLGTKSPICSTLLKKVTVRSCFPVP